MKSYQISGDFMNGVVNIFKPRGITSHDVVKKMRKVLGIKKIGHTGTLDPNASGVLPLCIGKGTRISEYLLDLDKDYIGELTLGMATDTQDMEGKVISYSNKEVNESDIYSAFNRFIGEIYQVPPMYSAIKHEGKKLYELAREGKEVERPSRKVKIYDLKIHQIIGNKKVIFYVRCSRGTYIRTLCNDIGEILGTYGYMSYLIRVRVGNFDIKDSYSIEYIENLSKGDLKEIICPLDKSLIHLDSIDMENKFYGNLVNGNIIPLGWEMERPYQLNKPMRVYCKGKFIGIGRIFKIDNKVNLKMDKVLI